MGATYSGWVRIVELGVAQQSVTTLVLFVTVLILISDVRSASHDVMVVLLLVLGVYEVVRQLLVPLSS